MAEPRWATYRERAVGADNVNGLEDTMNRAAKDFYAVWTQGHNDAGTHKLSGFLLVEEATYVGAGTGQTISLSHNDLDIIWIQITRPDTKTPVFASIDMTADETKQIGTNAFQSGMILDIGTPGEFTIGSDAAVDAVGITYTYLALGTR